METKKNNNPLQRAAACAAGILLIWACSLQPAFSFYNPSTGRWLSRDPAAEQGGPNLCAFARNDPIAKSDLLGLLPVGFNKSKDNTCCCRDNVIEAGKNRLLNHYTEIERQLLDDKVPRKNTKDPNYSCISINGYILSQITPGPACWVCWLERRGKSFVWPGGISWDFDHWVVVCESIPSSKAGEKIVLDYWENRSGASFDSLGAEWPYSYPTQSYIGSYRDCTGAAVQGDIRISYFGRPPPRR